MLTREDSLLNLLGIFFIRFNLFLNTGLLVSTFGSPLPFLDSLDDSNDITFAQSYCTQGVRFHIGQYRLVDLIALKHLGITGAVVHITPSIEEEFKPIHAFLRSYISGARVARSWCSSGCDICRGQFDRIDRSASTLSRLFLARTMPCINSCDFCDVTHIL